MAVQSGKPAADSTVVIWFRRDLRLADNAALTAATETGRPVLPVFVLEEGTAAALGGAARWWLHHSLEKLKKALAGLGLTLVIRRGDAAQVLVELARDCGAAAIHWNKRYEPQEAARDQAVVSALGAAGIQAVQHPGALLAEPWSLATGQGGPYRVFTPYYQKFLKGSRPVPPGGTPRKAAAARRVPSSLELAELELLPRADWAGGLRSAWLPGEAGAAGELARFADAGLARYGRARDLPAENGTSRLSAHLHWGEISARQVWEAVEKQGDGIAAPYLRQLVWREFAHHLLHHFPRTVEAPLREEFAAFPWDGDPTLLPAWQQGLTGYPLVDAGMRQLWHTGWMHNRVRMVAASFLVKHLLLPWQEGARWFADTLVDADTANNTFGWQWTAGCGADAAPFFRIFNPTLQSRKFDPRGEYIRRWVPELAGLPPALIHQPQAVAPAILEGFGVRLGREYPNPVVDHAAARQRALDSYRTMKAG